MYTHRWFSKDRLWAVGYFDEEQGKWRSTQEYASQEEAEAAVRELNGSGAAISDEQLGALAEKLGEKLATLADGLRAERDTARAKAEGYFLLLAQIVATWKQMGPYGFVCRDQEPVKKFLELMEAGRVAVG